MEIDYKPLQQALIQYGERKGRGAWTELEEKSGVHASGIARIAKGERIPNLETWSKLHRALPSEIPPLKLQGDRPDIKLLPSEPTPEERAKKIVYEAVAETGRAISDLKKQKIIDLVAREIKKSEDQFKSNALNFLTVLSNDD